MNNKTIIEFRHSYHMKNYGDRGGCYLPRPTASTGNTLLDLHNSSQDTQPHSLIVNYPTFQFAIFLNTIFIKAA